MSKKIMPVNVNALSFTVKQQDFNNIVAARQTVLPQYVQQENALSLLFTQKSTFSFPEILLKAAVLNSFYSTGIRDVYTVVSHIYSLCQNHSLKSLLANGDIQAVQLMKCVGHSGKNINHMSFASKYANFENPGGFPIMDNLVVEVFANLRSKSFFKKNKHFSKKTLKTNYALFKSVYDEFIQLSGMDKLSDANGNPLTYKDIDRYLWIIKKVQYAKKGINAAKVQLNVPAVSLIQSSPIYIYG